jgi:hypothetical protein
MIREIVAGMILAFVHADDHYLIEVMNAMVVRYKRVCQDRRINRKDAVCYD